MSSLRQLLDDAIIYPLVVRIAAAYILAGGTTQSYHANLTELRTQNDDAIVLGVFNSIRDFESGFRTIDDKLRLLATGLNLNLEEIS